MSPSHVGTGDQADIVRANAPPYAAAYGHVVRHDLALDEGLFTDRNTGTTDIAFHGAVELNFAR